MKLVSIKPQNVGPFAPDEELTLERDVTVITGPNDCGKSAFLRLIAMVCARSKEEVAGEQDVNLDFLLKATAPWDQDDRIACEARFVDPDFKYECQLAPGVWSNGIYRSANRSGRIGNDSHLLPQIMSLSQDPSEGVRQRLYLNDPNPTEQRFLKLAFGDSDFAALSKLSDFNFQTAIINAETTLNSKLESFLPTTLPFKFKFTNTSDKRELLFVHLIDSCGGVTALGYRGTGVQKMVNLLGRLAVENLGTTETLIIIDEPEVALHADAQHTFRNALEQLGSQPSFQVVYATHSPCMVNSMRPKSLRLLQRVTRDGKAYSTLVNDPFASNFARVRSSLGISPADSLLYAPVALIVEGKTEVLSLPILFQKLADANREGFGAVEQMLAASIFLEAEGTGNIGNLCRVARAQGSHVVVFVDGDHEKRWRQQLESYQPVEIIAMPKGKEFEEILPREIYFDALAAELGESPDKISAAAFDAWTKASKHNPKLAFTKQIDRWLTDEVKIDHFPKPAVMERASSLVDAKDVNGGPLHQAITAMRKGLPNA